MLTNCFQQGFSHGICGNSPLTSILLCIYLSKLALGLTEGVEDDLIQAVSIIRKSVGDDWRSYAESLKKLAIYYTHERRFLKSR